MQTDIPKRIRKRLNLFLATALRNAADTDTEGLMSYLEPAVDDLYAHTPIEAHAVLTEMLLHVAAEYELVDEVAHAAIHSLQAAEQADAGETGDPAA